MRIDIENVMNARFTETTELDFISSRDIVNENIAIYCMGHGFDICMNLSNDVTKYENTGGEHIAYGIAYREQVPDFQNNIEIHKIYLQFPDREEEIENKEEVINYIKSWI